MQFDFMKEIDFMKKCVSLFIALLYSLITFSQVPDSIIIYSAVSDSVNVYSKITDSIATAIPSEPIAIKQTNEPYHINPWIDIPLFVATNAWSIYGMDVIYNRDRIPEEEILALDKNNVNEFDRPITENYSPKAFKASNMFFYGSMPLPLLLMLDKKIRRDGLKIGLLYLETMGVTGTIYTVSAMSANRFRPYTYNPNVSMSKRTRGGARNSFFAGHVAVVATSTFFMAQVYTHYHPNMKGKWVLYALAGAATAATGYLRLQAGEHFKTDVITGVIVGTLVGNLVPHFHRNKLFNNSKLTLAPQFKTGSSGFTAYYKIGR